MELVRVVAGAGTTTWQVERGVEGTSPIRHNVDAKVELDPVYVYLKYLDEKLGEHNYLRNYSNLRNYAKSIGGDADLDVSVRNFLEGAIAEVEVRVTDAIYKDEYTLHDLPSRMCEVLSDSFAAPVVFHVEGWYPTRPTIVLVHGVGNSLANVAELTEDFQRKVGTSANVLGFFWGEASLDNGSCRTSEDLLSPNPSGDRAANLRGRSGTE